MQIRCRNVRACRHARRMQSYQKFQCTTQCIGSTNPQLEINKRTKLAFPTQLQNVEGMPLRCIGTGVLTAPARWLPFVQRSRAAMALYVDTDSLVTQIKKRAEEGIDDLATLVLDASVHKMVVVKASKAGVLSAADVLSSLSGPILYRARFAGTRTEALDGLYTLESQLGHSPLQRGDALVILWRVDQKLLAGGPDTCADDEQLPLQLHAPVGGAGLARGLFESLLGEHAILPEAKSTWLGNVSTLLAQTEEFAA